MWLRGSKRNNGLSCDNIENRSTLKFTDSIITQHQTETFIDVNKIGLCNGQIECEVLKVCVQWGALPLGDILCYRSPSPFSSF